MRKYFIHTTSAYRTVLTATIAILLQANVVAQTSNNEFGYSEEPDTTSTMSTSVGSPQGSFGVSPLGAATYTIGIEAPQGLPGMQPNVSIVYSSQSGNGVVGYGCSISGISVITRGPRTVYHDGKAGGISHGMDDAFYLDGQRLVLREHIAGNDSSVYCLENDPFFRIVLHGQAGTSQSGLWFSALDRNGIRYEYGHISGQQSYYHSGIIKVNAWYITRMENSVGNYMTFSYKLDNYYRYPETITYGRNSRTYNGVTNTVEFAYETRTDDPIPFSLEGVQGSISLRLKNVTTKTGSSVYRQYTFNYSSTIDTNNTKFSRLTSVNVANGDNQTLNPVTLSWQGLTVQAIQQQSLPVSTTAMQGTIDHEKSYYSCGDLNGDGLTDIFEKGYVNHHLGSNYNYHFYRVHTAFRDNNGNIGFTAGTELPRGSDYAFDTDFYHQYYTPSAIDVDGDGVNEMVIPERCKTFESNYIGFRFYGERGYKIGFKYDKETDDDDKYWYGIGDFNNDGKCEVAILENYQTSGYYYGAIMGAETLDNVYRRPFHFTLAYEPKDLYVADMNLDGLADVIVFHSYGYTIFWNDGTWLDSHTSTCTPNQTTCQLSNSISPARAFSGDFNGDGITDFLITVADNGTWYMELGKGDGTFTHKTACTINAYEQSATTKDDNQLGCYVYDMDGDGKSDAVICKGMYLVPPFSVFGRTYTYWLRSTGDSLQQIKMSTSVRKLDASQQYYILGDFNGDGLPELANKGYDCYNGENADVDPTWHVYPNTAYDVAVGKVSSVTNGFGAAASVTYKPMSDTSVYSRTTQTAVPDSAIIDCPPLFHVVSEVTSDDGAAGQQVVNYSYGGLKANLKGKGILGMSYTKAINTTQGTATASGVSEWNCESLLPKTTYTRQFLGNDSSQTVTQYSSTRPYSQKAWFNRPDSVLMTDMDGNESRVTTNYNPDYGYITRKFELWDDMASVAHNYNNYACYSGIWLPSVVENIRYSQTTDDLTTETYYEYNNRGQKTLEITDYNSTKPLTRTYTYDNNGVLASETVSGSGVATNTKNYTYDSTKRFVTAVTETADSHSLVNSATYDTWGNQLTETLRTAGNNPLTTHHYYDGWGFRTRTVQPTGQVSAFSRGWGNSGNRCYWLLERGTATPWVKTWYDRSGRKTYSESYTVLDVYASHTWQYDCRGRLTNDESAVGYMTTSVQTSYDARNRVGQQNYSDGRSMNYTYGNRTVTSTDGAGRSYTKTYDPRGNLLTSSDPSGVVSYTNNADGQPLTVTAHGATVTIGYDDRGNRESLVDPDAGTMSYEYDALGRIISQTDARSNETTFTYDGFGKLTATAINNQPHASYTYSYTGATAGLLTGESAGGATISYTYDAFDRLYTKTYTLTGTLLNQSMQYGYTYGTNGLLQAVSYPGGLNVAYTYDSYGNKLETKANGTTVWRLDEFDGIGTVVGHAGQLSSGTYLDYDGRINELNLSNGNTTLADLIFSYDSATGNLLSRESTSGAYEEFTYDNLDRLTGAGGQCYSYADNGNLTYKSGIGHYTYGSVRPHAVTTIENTDRLMALSRLDTEYNEFGKVSRIHDCETGRSLDVLYGPDDERYCSIQRYSGGSIEHEVIYLDGLDLWVDWDGVQKWTYYPEEHVITRKVDNGNFNHYFTFTDQVGSILKVVDANGTVKFSATYDPWGHQTVTTNQIGLIRGYTGHEMLTEYGLINMNGRLYDPLLGRFLSTDNFVQEPGSTQSFNRYSYCLNNPLMYNDPSGEIPAFIVAAAIGGILNVAMNYQNIDNAGQFFQYLAVGAGAGIAGMYAGSFATALVGVSGGVFGGAAYGFGAGLASGIITGGGNTWIQGGDWVDVAKGALVGGAFGGGIGALSEAVLGGLNAWAEGKDFWTGEQKMVEFSIEQLEPMPISGSETNRAIPDSKISTFEKRPTPYEKGKIGVNKTIEYLKAEGVEIHQTEVSFRIDGVINKIDIVGSKNGIPYLVESKNGLKAGFTKNQKINYPKMMTDHPPFKPFGGNALKVPMFKDLIPQNKSYEGPYILMIRHYF